MKKRVEGKLVSLNYWVFVPGETSEVNALAIAQDRLKEEFMGAMDMSLPPVRTAIRIDDAEEYIDA